MIIDVKYYATRVSSVEVITPLIQAYILQWYYVPEFLTIADYRRRIVAVYRYILYIIFDINNF